MENEELRAQVKRLARERDWWREQYEITARELNMVLVDWQAERDDE